MPAQTSPPPATAPHYVPSSIVNAANYRTEALAPNTLATLYGTNLAYVTRAVSGDEIAGGTLPTTLIGTGVKVLVGKIAAPILFVSPNQVNFLVPPILQAGTVDVQLGLDSRFGPAVKVKLADASPALFPLDPEFAVATRPDGSVVTREAPARGGEIIVVYATGLGATNPRIPMGQIVREAAVLARVNDFRVLLGGVELPRESILYAGATPGFAGLYQVNVKLPEGMAQNPEIRVGFPDALSPDGVRLPTE